MRSLCVAFQFSWASDDGILHSRRRLACFISFHSSRLYYSPHHSPVLIFSSCQNSPTSGHLASSFNLLTPSARFLCVCIRVSGKKFQKTHTPQSLRNCPVRFNFLFKSLLICIFHRGCNFLLVLVRVIFLFFVFSFNPFEMSEKMKERVRWSRQVLF